MRLHRPAALSIAAFAAAAAFASGQPAANASVHFGSPLAATQYFAAAANHDDMTALHQVTTPAAFRALMEMRAEARDVQAQSCTATGRGDYSCLLRYRYPHAPGRGQWNVIVAPAITPGWYVYGFLSCGGG